jgi:hypothetical protein
VNGNLNSISLVAGGFSSSSLPPRTSGHSFRFDSRDYFLIFGGRGGSGSDTLRNSVWKYNTFNRQFYFVHGVNNSGALALATTRPSPRENHASWVDQFGNLVVFGGWGFSGDGGATGEHYFRS